MAPLYLRLPERRTTCLTYADVDAIPAHLPGDLPHIPGMASSSASPFSVDEFLQGVPQAGPRTHQQEHFDAVYQQGLQHGLPPGQWQHQAPPSMYPPANADAQVLSPSLQVRQSRGSVAHCADCHQDPHGLSGQQKSNLMWLLVQPAGRVPTSAVNAGAQVLFCPACK